MWWNIIQQSMLIMDNWGRFPQGKPCSSAKESRYPTLTNYWPWCMKQFCITMQTTGGDAYPFTTDGHGIVNVRTHLGACRTTHELAARNSCCRCHKTAGSFLEVIWWIFLSGHYILKSIPVGSFNASRMDWWSAAHAGSLSTESIAHAGSLSR